MPRTVLITGAAGFIGRHLTRALAARGARVIATDRVERPAQPGVTCRVVDIRDTGLAALLEAESVDAVVHLAAILSPPPGMGEEALYDVDVRGTRNVVEACLAAKVRRFIYTSSGAAYGYSPANAALLVEEHPLRGNRDFAYAWHKRLVEESLERTRAEAPRLEQLIFRVSTVLGPGLSNAITAHFERPVVVGVKGAASPFCFAWSDDVVECLARGALGDATGIYNLTGDGVMTLREVARALGRPFIALPEPVMRHTLRQLHRRGWSRNSEAQLLFLQHRPVLSNERLKQDFGFTPARTSREAFEAWRATRAADGAQPAA